MRSRPSADPGFKGRGRGGVFLAVGVAVAAMAALHVLQPERNPVAQPVSFYVWGAHGWLLSVSLGAFGVALVALARLQAGVWPSAAARSLVVSGTGLLLAALVPSDRWFPWEGPSTVFGLLHAAAAMLSPALLLWPMLAGQRTRDPRRRRTLAWTIGVYSLGLLASAVSLALGLVRDGPPPWIGLFERLLACAAVSWICVVAWPARRSSALR